MTEPHPNDAPDPARHTTATHENHTGRPVPHDSATTVDDPIDLAAIEADLDGVQAALARLADGTYWTDEVTGDAIADDVLAAAPLTRRA